MSVWSCDAKVYSSTRRESLWQYVFTTNFLPKAMFFHGIRSNVSTFKCIVSGIFSIFISAKYLHTAELSIYYEAEANCVCMYVCVCLCWKIFGVVATECEYDFTSSNVSYVFLYMFHPSHKQKRRNETHLKLMLARGASIHSPRLLYSLRLLFVVRFLSYSLFSHSYSIPVNFVNV